MEGLRRREDVHLCHERSQSLNGSVHSAVSNVALFPGGV